MALAMPFLLAKSGYAGGKLSMNKSYQGLTMPTSVEKITIALPPEMVASMREAIQNGDYATSSEVVRDALRDWQRKRDLEQNGIAELRKLWQEARADKSPGLDPDEVFDELERKYQAMAIAAGAGR